MNREKQPWIQSEASHLTGHRYQKGNSFGRGRKEGSRNKATLALQELLEGQAEALTQKAVELALGGDTTALRLCLERLIPVVRERKLSLALPELSSAADVKLALNAVLAAVSNGEVTPAEAQSVVALLEAYSRAATSDELQQRITNLEQKLEAERGR